MEYHHQLFPNLSRRKKDTDDDKEEGNDKYKKKQTVTHAVMDAVMEENGVMKKIVITIC